jgi:hypothetical protein
MAELETDGVVGRRDLWRRRSAALADGGGSEQEARWEQGTTTTRCRSRKSPSVGEWGRKKGDI